MNSADWNKKKKEMNEQMKMLCTNMLLALNTFETHIGIAAMKDDGNIDQRELKELKAIVKATQKLEKTLENLT